MERWILAAKLQNNVGWISIRHWPTGVEWPRWAKPRTRLEAQIDRIEVGKRRTSFTSHDQPHAAPIYNVYSQIVYALKASDVRDVDGQRQVMSGP